MARNIGPAHPEKRLPVQQLPYELHELAKATNEALDRLCEACEREKTLYLMLPISFGHLCL